LTRLHLGHGGGRGRLNSRGRGRSPHEGGTSSPLGSRERGITQIQAKIKHKVRGIINLKFNVIIARKMGIMLETR